MIVKGLQPAVELVIRGRRLQSPLHHGVPVFGREMSFAYIAADDEPVGRPRHADIKQPAVFLFCRAFSLGKIVLGECNAVFALGNPQRCTIIRPGNFRMVA